MCVCFYLSIRFGCIIVYFFYGESHSELSTEEEPGPKCLPYDWVIFFLFWIITFYNFWTVYGAMQSQILLDYQYFWIHICMIFWVCMKFFGSGQVHGFFLRAIMLAGTFFLNHTPSPSKFKRSSHARHTSLRHDPRATGSKNTKRRLDNTDWETEQVFLDLAQLWEECWPSSGKSFNLL